MDFEKARFNMVEQQIRPWEVLDTHVLDTLLELKREDFVPPAHRSLAFADVELPLGEKPGEHMLSPKVEARILQAVHIRKSDKVLEIGTGSGFMAALLAAHADHVTTLEISVKLAALARANLARATIHNVTVVEGDGARGFAAEAPYDVIVLSGSTPVLAPELPAQLKVGGRLFAVVGEGAAMQAQLITRVGETQFQTVGLFETSIAPLENAPQPARFNF
ncbi:MAG: hypothetical protein RIR70_583 [Pseudomonadota bacterium]